jgi:hypothetical protein
MKLLNILHYKYTTVLSVIAVCSTQVLKYAYSIIKSFQTHWTPAVYPYRIR